MKYSEWIVNLLKEEHFDTLLNDIENNLLRQIASTKPEEADLREALYHKMCGVRAVKSGAVLAAKRKVTGGNT